MRLKVTLCDFGSQSRTVIPSVVIALRVIHNTDMPSNSQSETRRGFATIPYVKEVPDRVRRILMKSNLSVTTAFKPIQDERDRCEGYRYARRWWVKALFTKSIVKYVHSRTLGSLSTWLF